MDPKDFGRVGVLAGGPSNEREISLESGEAVFKALKQAGCETVFLDVEGRGEAGAQIKEADIDVAFIALHGRFGEDGEIQKILEEMDIPYTGSGPLASRLALDKIASKEIFIKNGIDVPQYKIVNRTQIHADQTQIDADSIGFPLVAKPQFEGSSIGISIVRERSQLNEAMKLAFTYGDRIILEEYIRGREITVGILGDEPLPAVEVIAKEQFYNFKAKYKSDSTRYIVPAEIGIGYYKNCQEKARLAHLTLGCRSFSRVDMMLDEEREKIFVLEVNSIPGLTSHSLLPKAASHLGISFSQLCLRILEAALSAKNGQKTQKTKKI